VRLRLHLRTVLFLIASACVLLWLARDYPAVFAIVCVTAGPAFFAHRFVRHLEFDRKRLTRSDRILAYFVALTLYLCFLIFASLVLGSLILTIIWLFTRVLFR
jgi:hypothetical protein